MLIGVALNQEVLAGQNNANLGRLFINSGEKVLWARTGQTFNKSYSYIPLTLDLRFLKVKGGSSIKYKG